MSVYERRVTRAGLLKAGAAGAVGLTFARPAFGGLMQIEATTLNWLTWSDHYANDQLAAVAVRELRCATRQHHPHQHSRAQQAPFSGRGVAQPLNHGCRERRQACGTTWHQSVPPMVSVCTCLSGK